MQIVESSKIATLKLNASVFGVDVYNLPFAWEKLASSFKQSVWFLHGKHWDYIQPGDLLCEDTKTGPCPTLREFSADILVNFFSAKMPPGPLPAPLWILPPTSLDLFNLPGTTKDQWMFMGSFMSGAQAVIGKPACRTAVYLNDPGQVGPILAV